MDKTLEVIISASGRREYIKDKCFWRSIYEESDMLDPQPNVMCKYCEGHNRGCENYLAENTFRGENEQLHTS